MCWAGTADAPVGVNTDWLVFVRTNSGSLASPREGSPPGWGILRGGLWSVGSPFPNWGISSTNVGLTSDKGGELGRGLVARKLGWGTDEVAPGLEFGIEREVEVTGDERLFIGMTLLYPPLHSFSSISTRGKGENI